MTVQTKRSHLSGPDDVESTIREMEKNEERRAAKFKVFFELMRDPDIMAYIAEIIRMAREQDEKSNHVCEATA